MWRGIGATGPWFSIPYFLLLVAVGHFFVLNLFLAVIFDNFDSIADAERAAKGQSELMEAATSEGREKSEQREAKRKADESYVSCIDRCLPERFRLRTLVDSRNFRMTAVALILLNAVALALQAGGQVEAARHLVLPRRDEARHGLAHKGDHVTVVVAVAVAREGAIDFLADEEVRRTAAARPEAVPLSAARRAQGRRAGASQAGLLGHQG